MNYTKNIDHEKKIKLCNGPCGQWKSFDEFYKKGKGHGKHDRHADKPRSWCKSCDLEKQQEKNGTEERRLVRFKYRIKVDYGLTLEEYYKLLDEHSYQCDVCGATDEERKLCIDHCHKTGAIRGILCQQHNTALGLLDDNLEQVESLLKYMIRSMRS